jgi:GTP cyclohydrolase II
MRKDISLQVKNSKTGDDLERKPQILRNYGIGAQILRDLGISRLKLLTNTRESSIKGIDGYGLKIVERVPIPRFDH